MEAQKRVALKKSVLDAVLENAGRTRARLGTNDQHRMDQFLDSVRGVEKRVVGVSSGMGATGCAVPPGHDLPHVEQSAVAPRQTTETYDKGLHADAMNDLIAMAFECDVTRIVSYMLEDERSEFTYDNVQDRAFTPDPRRRRAEPVPSTTPPSTAAGTPSPPSPGGTWQGGEPLPQARRHRGGARHQRARQLRRLPGRLHARRESRGHELPVAVLGGGNLGLETDQHLVLDRRPLRDLYFTLMNDVYGLGVRDFGQNLTGAPLASITELLKS